MNRLKKTRLTATVRADQKIDTWVRLKADVR